MSDLERRAERVLEAAREAGPRGIDAAAQSRALYNRTNAAEMATIRAFLVRAGLARVEHRPTKAKGKQRIVLIADDRRPVPRPDRCECQCHAAPWCSPALPSASIG